MWTKIEQIRNKFSKTLEIIKAHINVCMNNKRIVNYILYTNCGFIAIFVVMIFLLNQEKISNYINIREGVVRLKEVTEGYELEFTQAQATLEPNIKRINSLVKNAKIERQNIEKIIDDIDNPEYIQEINNYIKILDKRLVIRDELINQYKSLINLYKDYSEIAFNAETFIGKNLELQLQVKHIMLNLEQVRLMSKNTNRNKILNDIQDLRNKLIYEDPIIQEKVGLFLDSADEILKSLRYLDTMRSSMLSDGYNLKLENLKSLTSDHIDYEKIKFSGKLIFFLFLSIILGVGQFLILTLFFINKQKTEKLQKEAQETINKSKEIAERSRLYALEAQRTQFKILFNFCGDFDVIISNISHLSHVLKNKSNDISNSEDLLIEKSMIDNQKNSITTLNSSIIALEKWLSNYLEVYTPHDKWRDLSEEKIDVASLFDKNFAETRFFIQGRQHLLSIFHDGLVTDMMCDKEYLLRLFMNMIYVSVKWSDNSWLKSSIILSENKANNNSDNNKKHILTISIINGASNEKYIEGLNLFHKENEILQNQDDDNDTQEKNSESKESNDRFIVAAIYYMRQICDMLHANISFERNITGENALNVTIPIKTSVPREIDISVPILKNKNILVVSPYSPILRTMEQQLTSLGLNVMSLSDKYAAIGHIVGNNNGEQPYNLFMIDHNPPDIDAEALTKIIRENSTKNLAHVIVMTTETHLAQIEQNKSIYDAYFTKPVMPHDLKEKLEEFAEIQLYGVKLDDNDDIEKIEEEEEVCRFLAVMDEDLSTMLLQFILTKANFQVDVVFSSSQIFEFIEKHNYNFILVSNKCSWIVPENLSRDIRRHHSNNKDAVLIMIYDTLKDNLHKKLIKSGYDEFIPLPLSRISFLEKVEEWSNPLNKRMNASTSNIQQSNGKDGEQNQEVSKIEKYQDSDMSIDDEVPINGDISKLG